jgi:hypothetical protein
VAPVDVGRVLTSPALAATTVSPASEIGVPAFEVENIQALGRDERFLLTYLRAQEIEQGDMAVQALTQTGERKITGTIERDPIATSAKATVANTLTVEKPNVKQFALINGGLPDKMFYVAEGLGDRAALAPESGPLLEWVRDDLTFELRIAADAHAYTNIIAGKPPFLGEAVSFTTPKGALTAIQKAVSAHRALGARPKILAAGPKVSVELRTLLDKNEQPVPTSALVGTLTTTGEELTVIEVQEEHDPLLVDPMRLGCFYHSLGSLRVNGLGEGFKKNEVEVRLEFDGLFHVRDANGAFSLSLAAMK